MKKTWRIKNLSELTQLSQFLLTWLEPNIFFLLSGELGIGKTTLTQLIAANLGIKENINSPTFAICQRYQIEKDYYLNHFDFFRLKVEDNLDFFHELTINNINVIEWPEKNPQFWQHQKYIKIKIKLESDIRLVEISKNF